MIGAHKPKLLKNKTQDIILTMCSCIKSQYFADLLSKIYKK